MVEVILRVSEFRANLVYSKAGLSAEPITDVLYLIEVPEEGCKVLEDGTKIFNAQGMRHVLKGLQVALVLDSDKGDF